MFDIPMADFVGRLHLTEERVKFSQADAYGHLSSANYINLVFDHRTQAVKDQIGFDLHHWIKTQKLAFFLKDIHVQYLAPLAVGDTIEVTTWVRGYTERDVDIRSMVVGKQDRYARALVAIQFAVVNVETGRPVGTPETLPSQADRNLIVELPPVAPYLDTVKRLPPEWKAASVAEPRTT